MRTKVKVHRLLASRVLQKELWPKKLSIFHVAQVLAPGTAGYVTILGKKKNRAVNPWWLFLSYAPHVTAVSS